MTVATHTKAYRTWVDRIDSGVFTKSGCLQFAQAIARVHAGEDARGKRTALTPEECSALVSMLREVGGVRLTEEHTAQGVSWLTRYGTKTLGLPPEVMENFSHFIFRGDVRLFGYGTTLPVWRIVLTDGRAVDYYNAAWQTGVRSEDGWRWVETTPSGFGPTPFRNTEGPVFS